MTQAERNDLIGKDYNIIKARIEAKKVNDIVVIVDGTSIYLEQPTDNEQAQDYWCSRKKRHVAISSIYCSPRGFIFYLVGSFISKHNDALLTQFDLEKSEDIKRFLQKFRHENIKLMADRGLFD